MDLVHNGGGGGFEPSPLFTFFFTFNVKIMSKNWKRTIKQWSEENKQVSWTKSIIFFFFFFTSLTAIVY